MDLYHYTILPVLLNLPNCFFQKIGLHLEENRNLSLCGDKSTNKP